MKEKSKTVVKNVEEDIDSLFEEIETSDVQRTKEAMAQGRNPAFLQLKKKQTVRVVMLPYKPNPKNTFVTYEKLGFFNKSENTYVELGLSPRSKGIRRDPVSTLQWETYNAAKKAGDENAQKRSYDLLPKREEMVNVLILEDSDNPDNVGTVKVLKYGAALNSDGQPISVIYSKIRDGVFGAKKEKIGKRAFLTTKFPEVRPLVISVKEKGGFNDYSDTSFDDAEEHNFTTEEIEEFYSQCYDLEQFVPELKSNEELQQLLNDFWFQTDAAKEDEVDDDDVDDDDQPTSIPDKKPSAAEKLKAKMAEKNKQKADEVDSMLDDDDFNLDD